MIYLDCQRSEVDIEELSASVKQRLPVTKDLIIACRIRHPDKIPKLGSKLPDLKVLYCAQNMRGGRAKRDTGKQRLLEPYISILMPSIASPPRSSSCSMIIFRSV
jgi:hypothetical protein